MLKHKNIHIKIYQMARLLRLNQNIKNYQDWPNEIKKKKKNSFQQQ